MRDRPVFVASDQHLGVCPPEREAAFLDWLEAAGARASAIVLNGDLFDFWFEWRNAVPRGHSRALARLQGIVESGVTVHLLGGNHDWWVGSYLTDEIGVRFHPGPVRLELAGHRALVAHGDGLGPGDLGYRVLRGVLRSRIARWGFRWVHPDLGVGIARRVSRTPPGEIRDPARLRAQARRARILEEWARGELARDPATDVVLLGHTHLPASVEVDPGRMYINTGDWLNHMTYAVLEAGAPARLERWGGPGTLR